MNSFFLLFLEAGPPRSFFDEIRFLSEQLFESKDPEHILTYASDVAGAMHLYPPKEVLRAGYVYTEWRPGKKRLIYLALRKISRTSRESLQWETP